MKNTSKSNLKYQYEIILGDIKGQIDDIESIDDVNCDDLIEKLEGIKEIKVSLATLTN